MNDRLIYKALFGFALYMIIHDICTSYRMNQVPEHIPSSPLILSLVLWFSNALMLVASFGAAFRKYVIINYSFWIAIIVIDVTAELLSLYFDVKAGGYGEEDIMPVLLITLMIISVYILAPLRYCQDIKLLLVAKESNS